MEYFRNPEIKLELCIYIASSSICTLGMFLLCGTRGVLGTAAICLLFGLFYLVDSFTRYRHIAAINTQIDEILHGENTVLMQDCREGELAILATQINKMVHRLREQAEQLAADKILMADYMADISHQLKTPLTSIRLISSFLQEETLEKSRRMELTFELSQLIGKVEWLVYALLRISKLDAGTITLKKEKISVASLWQQAYNTLAISLELRGIGFQNKIDNSITMLGDTAWTREAMENILKNCMEHTPENGTITVTAEENPLYTSIQIMDTGTGIDTEDLPHIFERFYRGKHSDTQSVGIGLALSKRIITSQNGTIQAGNRKDGNGAFFEIRFYKTVV